MPGESYPSGGAVTKVLDIYKWFTPHLDVIAPDNYQLDTHNFKRSAPLISREDNPLFMPETIGNQNMFHAIAEYNSIANSFSARIHPGAGRLCASRMPIHGGKHVVHRCHCPVIAQIPGHW